ncbi:MAG TPA: UDP-glucose 4-epimerase GalE [Anaerolineales bacterium]|nr:UDP-glucose 4-epimerase GalE [Anaerolineales bacterium]
MKLLITGGAGYIGSATAEALLLAGHQVTVYDSLITGHRNAVPDGCEFIQADLADHETLGSVLMKGKFDAIYHFAAFIEAGESMKNPAKYIQNNYVRTSELIEQAVKNGVGKFIFSSTAAVYKSSDAPLTEESTIEPANVYGFTKLAIEETLEWYQQIFGLRYGVFRYFNASGALPGRGEAHQPETHLIPRVIQVAMGQAQEAQIYGTDYDTPDGTCIRDYIHIGDLVSAKVLGLSALEDQDHFTYCLGSGSGYSVREVISMIKKVSGVDFKVVEFPRRTGDAARLIASSEKIQKELGWKPTKGSLQDIISSAWEWHINHPQGYNK